MDIKTIIPLVAMGLLVGCQSKPPAPNTSDLSLQVPDSMQVKTVATTGVGDIRQLCLSDKAIPQTEPRVKYSGVIKVEETPSNDVSFQPALLNAELAKELAKQREVTAKLYEACEKMYQRSEELERESKNLKEQTGRLNARLNDIEKKDK